MAKSVDVVLYNGKITTLDRQNPGASAVAILDGRFLTVGADRDVMALADSATKRFVFNGLRDPILSNALANHWGIRNFV